MPDRTDAENEDIDRSPPIAVLLSGESFFRSAQYLRRGLELKDLRLRFNMPIYSHALELALKAYLRSKGVTSNQLASRAFGHSLQVLWDTCVDQGLTGHPVSDAFISQIVEFLNPFATDFEFRYIRVGLKNLPTLDAVEDAVAKLIATVRPYCEATVNGAIAD